MPSKKPPVPEVDYLDILVSLSSLLEEARRAAARAVNTVMTTTYWEIGRRIVEHEQRGQGRADYGKMLVKRLSTDLSLRFGRGFGEANLHQMRRFFREWPILRTASGKSAGRDESQILQTASEELVGAAEPGILQTLTGESAPGRPPRFPLPWSHYVRLMSVKNLEGRAFYEAEALRGGWTVRQLDRQISSQFYERAALSRNKAAMLNKGAEALPEDAMSAQELVKDPFILEFLDLKDEYSEIELEEGLIRHLETFLLELGGDFAFIGRQRRLRIGDQWFRVDLVFFHRRLRCLVVIDLKLGAFSHADAGQMHMYLNYAREHWTHKDENPPVGLILCAQKNEAVAKYALEGLPNQVLAAEYRSVLPDEQTLVDELARTRKAIEERHGP